MSWPRASDYRRAPYGVRWGLQDEALAVRRSVEALIGYPLRWINDPIGCQWVLEAP